MNTSNKIHQLEKEARRLQGAVEELSILNEIATAISSTMALDKLLDLIAHKCVKHLKIEQAAVMLLDEEKEDRPFHTMIRKADASSYSLPYRLDTQLTGWMIKHKAPLLINDFPHDDRFQGISEESFPVRSLLSIPLLLKGRMIGLLAAFNKKTAEEFTEEDKRLFSIIAAQSAQVIENTRLYEEEQTLLRMRQEYRLASEIQHGLLPKTMPKIPDYDIAGLSYPAQIVGGDYFDFIQIDKNRLAICLGDISGKGLPAALLMANLQATIRGQTLLTPPPKDCLARANRLLYQSTDPQKFATLFYGILDNQKHQMCYANAGHNRPMLFRREREAVFLKTAGLALSFTQDTPYDEETISFDPGDLLLIYSDGITEAMNTSDEEFGEEKLISTVKEHLSEAASGLIQNIISSVKKHAGNRPQSDDMTLAVIKRREK